MYIYILNILIFIKNFPLSDIENSGIYLLVASGIFIISALGIIFNPAIYGVRKKIKEELNGVESKVNDLYNKINELSEDFVNYNTYIKDYISKKETVSSLEQTIENGLGYIDENKDIYIYLNEVSRTFIKIIGELLDIGIENLNERILKNKMLILDRVMYEDKNHLVDKVYLNKLKKTRKRDNQKTYDFINGLLKVSEDDINSKTERFRNMSESFLYDLLRDIILIYNKKENE